VIIDVMVWEDPDMDAVVFENVGGIAFAGDNMLLVQGICDDPEMDPEVIAGFNKEGWCKFEINPREEAESA
jgi:hypothetical protein